MIDQGTQYNTTNLGIVDPDRVGRSRIGAQIDVVIRHPIPAVEVADDAVGRGDPLRRFVVLALDPVEDALAGTGHGQERDVSRAARSAGGVDGPNDVENPAGDGEGPLADGTARRRVARLGVFGVRDEGLHVM